MIVNTARWALLVLLLGGLSFGRTHKDYSALISKAEISASSSGKKVLMTARKMVSKKIIVRGSCWDYLNAAYTKAGFPSDRRKIVFKSSKRGPYVPISAIRPGDWLYYINHSYGNIEHSGMFIGWINRSTKTALVLSYGGENRKKPGRYRPYDLSSVYQIIRAK